MGNFLRVLGHNVETLMFALFGVCVHSHLLFASLAQPSNQAVQSSEVRHADAQDYWPELCE